MADGSVIPFNPRSTKDWLDRIKSRDAQEAREMDAEAKRLVDGIILSVAAAMHQSDMVTATINGCVLHLSLSRAGIDYLRDLIEPPIRGALADQRNQATAAVHRDRLELGSL